VKSRRQTSTKPARARAHDGAAAASKRMKKLEAEVQQLRHNADAHRQKIASLQAELDHCMAKMQEVLGGRFR